MELESIRLYRHFDGVVAGEIQFKDPKGTVSLTLTESNCQDILEVLADQLVEQSKEISKQLTSATITDAGKRALSAPTP